MKALIIVDMQNDFIDGALGSHEAVAIVPNVVNKMKEHIQFQLISLNGKPDLLAFQMHTLIYFSNHMHLL